MRLDLDSPRGDEWPNLSALEAEKEATKPATRKHRAWTYYVRVAIEAVLLVISIFYLRCALSRYFP
jgi:hypothetical protein